MADERPRLWVGEIRAAHGVKGLVKLKSFTDNPRAIADYRPLTDAGGRREFSLTLKGAAGDHFIAAIEGVQDRDAADALRGTRLYAARALLPSLPEGQFYHADLIGLRVRAEEDSSPFAGRVTAVDDYGAGPLLTIMPVQGGIKAKDEIVLPFNRRTFPKIDLAGGLLWVRMPEGLEASPEAASEQIEGRDGEGAA